MALTKEAMEILAKPFPKQAIKSFKGRGGVTMRYIDVKDLEDRIASVDPSFEKEVTPGARSVAVHYTILGVKRGDLFDNDSEANKYGAPQVNALARASRRAARLFGVGAEVWEKEEDVDADEDEDEAPRRPAKSSGKSSGKVVKLSAKQEPILVDKGFTRADLARIADYGIVTAAIELSKKKKMARGDEFTRKDIEALLSEYGIASKSSRHDDYEDEEEEEYDE